MMKARPIWEELPINFKRHLVDSLDFKSRCRLKTCSKSDQEIVISRPIRLESVTICPPDEITLNGTIYKCSGINQLIEIVIHIFENPKSFVKSIDFNFDRRNQPENVQFFLESFLGQLKLFLRKNQHIKFKSEILYYEEYYRRYLEDRFLDVLKFFDPKILRTIKLTSNISYDFVDQICDTEQWKNAREVKAFGCYDYDFPMHYFLHFNRLNAQYIRRLNAEQCWKIIESFVAKNPPNDSSFLFQTEYPLPVDEILKKFSVPVINEPTEAEIPTREYIHTQRFELENPENVLTVKFTNTGMYGAVCRKRYVEADFRWAAFRVRIDY